MDISQRRTATRDEIGGRRGPVELETRNVIVQFLSRPDVARLTESGAFVDRIAIYEVPDSLQTQENLWQVIEEDSKEEEKRKEKEKKEERERRRRREDEKRRDDDRRYYDDRSRDDYRRYHDGGRRSIDDRRRSPSPRNRFPEVRNRLPTFFQDCLTVKINQ